MRSRILEAYEAGAGCLRAYVEQVLCANLHPGDVLVLDNLSAHKVACIRGLIVARGAQLPYLPACSPDLNPSEKVWSKCKQFLRSAKARTAEALDQAIAEALKTITQTTSLPGSVPAATGIRLLWPCSSAESLVKSM